MSKLRRITVTGKGVSRPKDVNSGFTLVELLVVIAIIALLMSILMPALRRVKMQAEVVKCNANSRQVGLIIFMQNQENDFKLPDFGIDDNSKSLKTKASWSYPGRSDRYNNHLWTADGAESSPRLDPTSKNCYWGVAFSEYVKDIDIFGCPAMTQFAEMLAKDTLYTYANLAPGVDGKDVIQTAALGLNGYIGGGLNTNSIRIQSEVVICTDHVEPRNEQADEANRGDMFCTGVDDTNLTHFRARPFRDTKGPNRHHIRNNHYRGIFRHNIRHGDDFRTGGSAAVLWLDGSIGMIKETYGMDDPYGGEDILNRYYDPRGLFLDITPPAAPQIRK